MKDFSHGSEVDRLRAIITDLDAKLQRARRQRNRLWGQRDALQARIDKALAVTEADETRAMNEIRAALAAGGTEPRHQFTEWPDGYRRAAGGTEPEAGT